MPRLPGQLSVGGLDFLFECIRERSVADPAADFRASLRERLHVVDVERRQRLVDAFLQSVDPQELVKGEGRGREAVGHADPRGMQLADHFAERCVLATDTLDIGHAQVIEGDHPFLLFHSSASAVAPRHGEASAPTGEF